MRPPRRYIAVTRNDLAGKKALKKGVPVMSPFREVTRPWGNYKLLLKEDGFEVKRLEINPGTRFSLQKHLKRAETWTIAKGEGLATIGAATIRVRAGSIVEIQKGQLHRLQNTGTTPLIVIEVQLGDKLDEKDIVRIEDDFGRTCVK